MKPPEGLKEMLTLNVQVHALLVAADPAECLAVEAAQVGEPHTADGQHRLAMATPHFKSPIWTLPTHTHEQHKISNTCILYPFLLSYLLIFCYTLNVVVLRSTIAMEAFNSFQLNSYCFQYPLLHALSVLGWTMKPIVAVIG